MINSVKWTQPLDVAEIPNKANLRAALASPSFDPTRKSSLPWASGAAGIAYNIATTGKEIKTIDDFLAAKGTKTVLTEMRDTIGLLMLADGKDITKPVYAEAEPSFDLLEAALGDGRISGANGNEYVTDLAAGNLAAAISWSGRRRADLARQPRHPVRGAGVRRHVVVRQLHDPEDQRPPRPRVGVHQLLLRPEERRGAHRHRSSTSRRSTASPRNSRRWVARRRRWWTTHWSCRTTTS